MKLWWTFIGKRFLGFYSYSKWMAFHLGIGSSRYWQWETGHLIPHGSLILHQKGSSWLNSPYLCTSACSFSWKLCTEFKYEMPSLACNLLWSRATALCPSCSFGVLLIGFPKMHVLQLFSPEAAHLPVLSVSSSSAWKCAIIERVKKNPLGKANYCMQILLCVIKEGTI